MRQIVLDTETTGLEWEQGHRIIEVGCIELVNRRFTGNNLHFYINPERELDEGAVAVHGLTTAFLKDKPIFADIVHQLVDYIKDAELIIHNAPFDVGFLNYEFKRFSQGVKRIKDYCQVLDTLKMARLKYPGQKNNLDALCRRLEVDNSSRDLHGALLDAKLLAQVYLQMTGGQALLFQKEAAIANKADQPTINLSSAVNLPIINPTEAELALHQKILADMQSAGKCLWYEDSN